MRGDTKYLLDASVLIEAAKRYYAFDLGTPFWNILIDLAENGRILSIDRVKGECERGNDELAEWVKGEFARAFALTDEQDVIKAYREVIAWVQAQPQFTEAARAEFAEGADGWLVAYAKVRGCEVVTEEQPSPDAKKRVPIPNVCQAFKVPSCDTFKMLRMLGVRFT